MDPYQILKIQTKQIRFTRRWKWERRPIALLFAILSLWAGLADRACADPVSEVVNLYDQGLFQQAELLALRTLQSADSLAPIDRGILYRTLGFTYVALGENEKAKIQFKAWLDLDPLANLDSVYISPKIVRVFREAEAEHQLKIAEHQKEHFPPIDMRREAAVRSMILPGWGQIHADRKFKGYSLMGSEALLVGAIIFCQIQYADKRDSYLAAREPDQIQEYYDQANTYYRARNVSIGLAIGVYLFSLYDALHLSPQTSNGKSLTFSCRPRPDRFLMLTLRF